MFLKDRYQAACLLTEQIRKYSGENAVVMAIPRGGLPIGYHIAKELHFPLGILLSKKIGHPLHPEVAIGAVSMEGEVVDKWYSGDRAYVKREIKRIRENLKKQYLKFMGNREQPDLKGKTVIIVDDGIATGYTILGCVDIIRKFEPEKIVVATPVAPPDTILKIRKKADEVICLYIPENFSAVGQFYEDFSEVTDEDVIRYLNG